MFQKHEISLATKQACGISDSSSRQNLSITSMIQKRIIGPAFSTAERCRISNNFLPNKNDLITKYNSSKIYCGSYSKDGNLFLTASQGIMLVFSIICTRRYSIYGLSQQVQRFSLCV